MYEKGLVRINRLKQQVDKDGICVVPFVCYICDKEKSDFSMISGDGCPICEACISRLAGEITEKVNAP